MRQIGITQMTEPGRYVFYAPGTEAPEVKDAKVFKAPTNSVFFGIRLLAKDEDQQMKDLAGIQIYPLSKSDDHKPTKVIKVDHKKWQGWQPRGLVYYELLADMQSDKPGWGQIYLATYRDSDDDWLDGGSNYVLNLPPDVPAAEFWSLTVYDVATRAPIVNEQVVADKSSRMDRDVNDDGSVTLYIGPDEPEAGPKNWIPTVSGRAWFPYFRFYSPTQAYFDRSWVLPDIEKRSKAQ